MSILTTPTLLLRLTQASLFVHRHSGETYNPHRFGLLASYQPYYKSKPNTRMNFILFFLYKTVVTFSMSLVRSSTSFLMLCMSASADMTYLYRITPVNQNCYKIFSYCTLSRKNVGAAGRASQRSQIALVFARPTDISRPSRPATWSACRCLSERYSAIRPPDAVCAYWCPAYWLPADHTETSRSVGPLIEQPQICGH